MKVITNDTNNFAWPSKNNLKIQCQNQVAQNLFDRTYKITLSIKVFILHTICNQSKQNYLKCVLVAIDHWAWCIEEQKLHIITFTCPDKADILLLFTVAHTIITHNLLELEICLCQTLILIFHLQAKLLDGFLKGLNLLLILLLFALYKQTNNIILNNLPYPNITKHWMFSACLSRCEKISQADLGRNWTHDLLITRQAY